MVAGSASARLTICLSGLLLLTILVCVVNVLNLQSDNSLTDLERKGVEELQRQRIPACIGSLTNEVSPESRSALTGADLGSHFVHQRVSACCFVAKLLTHSSPLPYALLVNTPPPLPRDLPRPTCPDCVPRRVLSSEI